MTQLFGFDTERQWEYENGFYLTSHQTRLCKMLAHYELYKTILKLPGHIVECGVFKGASLIRFATFREALENPFSRKLIGFDAFGKFPKQEISTDQSFIDQFERVAGEGIPIAELKKVFSLKGFSNFELIAGDIVDTVPKYISDHPELKIALLHIDVDVYGPTRIILEHLFDRVVRGGIVVFDDFGTVEGETRAIDEFFQGMGAIVEKLNISHTPSYLVKL